MKRILIFSTAYHPYVGGAEIAVREITDRLPGYVFDMVVPRLSRSLSKRERIGAVNVERVGIGCWLDKFLVHLMFFRARRLHQELGYKMVWSIMASQASVAAATFKEKHRDIPLVLTLQEGDEEEHLKRYVLGSTFLYRIFIQPWHMRVFNVADHVTAISTYLIERAVRNGIERKNTTLVPNGFGEAFLDEPRAEDVEALRTYLHKSDPALFQKGARILITTSRLVPKNGIDTAIRALAYVPEDVVFLVVGDGPERKSLEKLAESEGVGGRVHFAGAVSYKELPKYCALPGVCAFVRPSRSEGFGNSFIEAMAAGVPVVATPVGGISDFLTDGETGLYAEPDNPRSVADAVRKYIENDTLRERIAHNARAFVAYTYEWDTIARCMEEEVFNPIIAHG